MPSGREKEPRLGGSTSRRSSSCRATRRRVMKRFSVPIALASLFTMLAVTPSLSAASAPMITVQTRLPATSAPLAPVEIQLEAWVGPSLLWVCSYSSGSDCGSHSIQRGLTQNLRYRVAGTDRNIVCTSSPVNFPPWPQGSWDYTANGPDVLWTVDCAGDTSGATKFVHLTSPDPNPPPPPPPPPPPACLPGASAYLFSTATAAFNSGGYRQVNLRDYRPGQLFSSGNSTRIYWTVENDFSPGAGIELFFVHDDLGRNVLDWRTTAANGAITSGSYGPVPEV